MNITIRKANGRDINWIVEQLKDFSKFYGGKYPLFDDPNFAFARVSELVNKHFFVIAIDSDTLTKLGFVSGYLLPHVLNPNIKTLSEVFWYVVEHQRHKGVSTKLLEAYIEFGKAHAQWITFTVFNKTQIYDSFFINRGFDLKEKTYLMEV